ncbi:unnamed protein product [Fraxinus pennsylvanica]|uniref:NAC domain-containing protein n=1 Tax=Fraxinus pennsylvanica TaxID=56036 RepID=A0AAD1ZNA4_9LAMI|nr:unnamed protein product [Fraxinus pennsylvanica]
MENQQNNVAAYPSHVSVPHHVVTTPSHVSSVHNNVVTTPSHVSIPNNVVTTPSHVFVPNSVVTTPSHVSVSVPAPVPVVNDVYVPWESNVNLSMLSNEEYFSGVPPGYRFKPLDWELIVHYLMKKINNETLPRNKIYVVDLYKCNPERLANDHRTSSQENEWFFFTPRNRKYKKGMRPDRAADGGYWKATGADKIIKHNGEEIGLRKALVFYTGKPPTGEKTSWIMHEFRLKNAPVRSPTSDDDMKLDDWILCKIYKKERKTNKNRNQQRDGNNPEEAGNNENKDTSGKDSSMEVENSLGLNEMESNVNFSEGCNGNNYTRQFDNVATHGFPCQNLGAEAAQMWLQNLPSMGSYISTSENAGTYGHAPVPIARVPPMAPLGILPRPPLLGSGVAINENASTSWHSVSGTTMVPPVSSWLPNLPFIENYGSSCSENEVSLTDMMLQMPCTTQDLPFMGNYVTTSDNVGTFIYAAPDPAEPPILAGSPNNSFTSNFVGIPDDLKIMTTGLDEELPEIPPMEVDDVWEYWVAEGKNNF